MSLRLVLLTCLTMLAFASNSILCRLALMHSLIDPVSYTVLRLSTGALVLYVLARARQGKSSMAQPTEHSSQPKAWGSWSGAVALFLYATTFSLAYLKIESGVGALILFGAVQLSMFLFGLLKGERLGLLSIVGLVLSVAGLVYLLLPGSSAPPLGPAALMAVAGAGWGWYSILGKGAANPLAATAGNFVRAVPLSLLVVIPFFATLDWTALGALYAILSGGVASGLGYTVWYSVMGQISVLKASTVQLSVPILTALIGAALLGESLTLQLVLACVMVLGGIALVLAGKRGQAQT